MLLRPGGVTLEGMTEGNLRNLFKMGIKVFLVIMGSKKKSQCMLEKNLNEDTMNQNTGDMVEAGGNL